MSDKPSALVPVEVDLRDFAFMPLDVVRLRDSGLTAKASGDEFRAAVLLWCASWHQQPAASLPNDDEELANLCGYGRAMREWAKVRKGAMRGWVECDDGRLYHPTVAAKAIEAWQSKLAQRARTEAARKARDELRQRKLQELSQEPKKSVTETVTESKGQGQGQGQGYTSGRGGKPPADQSKVELWASAVSLLSSQGMPEPQARTFVGKLAKDYPVGDIVLDAVRSAVAQQPADARAYLLETCKRMAQRKGEQIAVPGTVL